MYGVAESMVGLRACGHVCWRIFLFYAGVLRHGGEGFSVASHRRAGGGFRVWLPFLRSISIAIFGTSYNPRLGHLLCTVVSHPVRHFLAAQLLHPICQAYRTRAKRQHSLVEPRHEGLLCTYIVVVVEGAVHLTMELASVELGIYPIGCNNPVKRFACLASANPMVR